MFQKHLVDDGNLLYADFMNDLAKIMVCQYTSCPKIESDLRSLCLLLYRGLEGNFSIIFVAPTDLIHPDQRA